MNKAKSSAERRSSVIDDNSVFKWIAAATILLLAVPFIAMRFDTGVEWSAADFVVMAFLLFVCASGFVLVARRVHSDRRLLVGLIFVALFLYAWAELAVGVFTH